MIRPEPFVSIIRRKDLTRRRRGGVEKRFLVLELYSRGGRVVEELAGPERPRQESRELGLRARALRTGDGLRLPVRKSNSETRCPWSVGYPKGLRRSVLAPPGII